MSSRRCKGVLHMKKHKSKWRRVVHDMRLQLVALVLLTSLMVLGMLAIYRALLQNAQDTGAALARSYAAEEQSALSVYETLLSFGTASMDEQLRNGTTEEGLAHWLQLYFQRLETVLGEGAVDPYAVLDGTIVAANPWEGDETYNVYSTQWYQKAVAAAGNIVFTDVYTDAIYQKPVITIAQKCKSTDALLVFDIFPENFQFSFDPVSLKPGNSYFLCDSAGTLIYQVSGLDRPAEEIQQYLDRLIAEIEAGNQNNYKDYILDLDGKRRGVYYSTMSNGWYSVVTVPYSNILGEWTSIALFFSLMLGVFMLALAAMAWRSARLMDRIDRTNETVQVLSNSYYALYRVDFSQGTYEMIKGSDYMRSRLPEKGAYETLLQAMSEVIEPDACDDYLRSFSKESIQKLVARRVRDFGGEFLRRFGEDYHWVSIRVLFDESLAPEEVVLSFREVDQEKQIQIQERKLLENALEAARQNETAKQAFFSNMSHDMRTPLNAIIGLSDLAANHADDPEKTYEYLQKIATSSRQLLSLINDILDMSHMEQGNVVLNNQQLNLKECVEECLETFRYQAEKENKTLTVHINLRNARIIGDSLRIHQILNNLLSNAFKFTEAGDTVSVSVSQIDDGDYAKYKFVVADTGIGMTPEFLPNLFEPYAREMRFSAKQASGTGLGMPITKSLVTQMDGEIQVESEPGNGSTFIVILPFATVKEAENAQALPSDGSKIEDAAFSLEGRHILLAEDNEVNMEVAAELLSMQGVVVTKAFNGVQAVELFRSSEPFAFDAVLMDMQMPEMDGCEAAKRIRAMRRPDAKGVPIIAVTANAFSEDVASTAGAGMDAHISKPIDFQLLCRTLSKLVAPAKKGTKEHNHTI